MMPAFTLEDYVLMAAAIPFAGAALIPLCHRWPNVRETVTLTAAVLLLLTVLQIVSPVLAGARPEAAGPELAPGLRLSFKVEPLGLMFALIASSLWILNSIYSIGYMRANDEPRQTSFYVCFAVAIGSTIALAFSKNLITMFLAYEALTISTYPLVTHKANETAIKAGRVYLVLLLATSMVLFLPAIVATWALAGTTEFTPGGILAGKADDLTLSVLLALFVFGIGKAAVMPVHFWLPAAMVAPTPVSALLHAVAVVKAGVFSILKIIVYIFGIETLSAAGAGQWLLVVSGFTIVAASLVALRQDNLKKRLAYSTVSQLSYVVLAAALLTPLSAMAAAVHIAAHAFAKITLFFCAGSIYTAAHKTEVSQLDGIGRRMPWTMGAFAIGALSMIGVPPAAGFVSKWLMLSAADASAQWTAVAVIVVSTVLNALYFLPIVYRAFFCDEPASAAPATRGEIASHAPHAAATRPHGEAPWPIVLALTVTALMTVMLFLLPDVPLALAEAMAGGATHAKGQP